MKKIIQTASIILLLKNPLGTIIGGIFGAVTHEVIVALDSPMTSIPADLGSIDQMYYILLGVALFNLKQLFFPKRLSPSVEEAIELLNIACRKGKLPPEQSSIMYTKLFAKYLDHVEFIDTTRAESARLADILSRSSDD
jgi:hypothetical protein